MIYCSSDYDALIREKYFDRLNALAPEARFAEKFRLMLSELPLHLESCDMIFGWYGFESRLPESKPKRFDGAEASDAERAIMDFPLQIGSTTNEGSSHTCVDYGSIITDGLISYDRRIESELLKNPGSACLQAMRDSIAAVRMFSGRLADECEKALATASGDDRVRLSELLTAVKKVPYLPADTFLEAVQSVWIIHFLIPFAENAWCSVSLGRFDKYMYPFYKKAVDSGEPRERLDRIMREFYTLLNSYSDGACLLNVGSDYNELSEYLIDCQKKFAMPAPILGARISDSTPDSVLLSLIDNDLFRMGQPTFYSEQGCVDALVERGVDPVAAAGFSNNSCMGICMPSREYNSMWGCVFNISACLEAAVNCGKLSGGAAVVPDIGAVSDTEELFDAFRRCAEYLFDRCAASYELKEQRFGRFYPDPFVSALISDCIGRGADRVFGADFHCATVECMSMINASDGLCAIDKLVFREKKYALSEVAAAVADNFSGREKLRHDLLSCPKYGSDPAANAFSARVADILQKIIRSHSHDRLFYMPSLHTIDANVYYGASWGAGFDGRLAGTPFAKNAGPANSARVSGPTSVLRAAANLPQRTFFGGQPIDIHFASDTVENHKDDIAALVRVYLSSGGLQFQVNSISSATLREAHDNPDKFPDLVVRVGGFSSYFRKFSSALQLEFIERFQIEENS